ncbi:putative polyketide synthase [Desarmillaria tabescens]|uniref:Polyketide synthase n=1 Tax=Armillaria tabescens TaxID=1929756 RepID=A0AA39JU07_ARMTA|nr:putative polyketide synthase [Desarmillaria tabescens]KAK0447900.1 putative polyketide synthase [Desarmillaria tabescens]
MAPKSESNTLPAIAIVGISTELPSGQVLPENLGHSAFFQFLLDKRQSYETIPLERFDIDTWYGKKTSNVVTKKGSFLKSIALFDPLEFGISSRDVAAMAVSTRKLIEHSFLALLDSGIHYRGQNVGCFMSSTMETTYTTHLVNEELAGSLAGYPYSAANKVSYHLDLRGPTIPTTTACSSTASALYLAVQALRAGDCEAAVVGGCQLNYTVEDWIQYSDGKVLSPDGECKPFDASADGFSRGEGVAVIVVKFLDQAISDGDHIYASILGVGINSTGSAGPVSAPVADAQADAMRRAFAGTGRKPSEVDFVELHATGTAVGDPTEANWVGKAFQRDDTLPVGSVKGNIGHLEITSFFASVSKVCSMFETRIIPPTVGIRTLNPAIDSLSRDVHRIRTTVVSINSSGIGGANGHALLEAPPSVGLPTNSSIDDGPTLLVTGGLSPRSASANTDSLAALIKKYPSQARAISTIHGRQARQMTWRTYGIYNPKDSVLSFSPPALCPRQSSRSPIIFVFSGQGPQHINMGRELFKAFPVFRDSVFRMDAIYKSVVGHSLVLHTGLFTDEAENSSLKNGTWPISIIIPSLAILQMALVDLLRSVGIVPDAVFGHSAGETPMLYGAGLASQEMALKLAIARGRAFTLAEDVDGCMAAMSCSSAQAGKIIQSAKQDSSATSVLEIACFNGPDAVTISGHRLLVEHAIDIARSKGIFATKLRSSVPVHSTLMDICHDEFQDLVSQVFEEHSIAAPSLPVYSTVTGNRQSEAFTSQYFWANARQPVLFSSAAACMRKDHPDAIYVEIGPHPVLATYLEDPQVKAVLCPLIRPRSSTPRSPSEAYTFLDSLGRINVLAPKHSEVDFRRLNMYHGSLKIVPAIVYPFQRKEIPYYRGLSNQNTSQSRIRATRNGPLGQKDMNISASSHPSLIDRVICGEPVMPAAGYIEMAFAAGGRVLWNVAFEAIMPLSKNARPVKFELDSCRWTVVSTVNGSTTSVTQTHAQGHMSKANILRPPDLDISTFQSQNTQLSVDNLYKELSYFAQYGTLYQRVNACWMNEREGLFRIRGADEEMISEGYVLHPAILDSCIHSAVHHRITENMDPNSYFLPSRVEVVTVYDKPEADVLQNDLYAKIIRQKWMPDAIVFDVSIVGEHGQHILKLSGLQVERHHLSPVKPISRSFDMVHQPYGLPNLPLHYPSEAKGPKPHSPERDSSHQTPNGDTSPLDLILAQTTERLHRAIDLIADYGIRVLRILDLTAEDSICGTLASQVLHLMNEKQVFLEYSSVRPLQTPFNSSDGCSYHNVRIEWDRARTDQHDSSVFYDIILGVDANITPSHIDILYDLLVPGGKVIISVVDKAQKPLLKLEDLWRTSIQEHFHSSKVTTGDSILIEAQKIVLQLPDVRRGNYNNLAPSILSFSLGGELAIRGDIIRLQSSNAPVIWIESTMNISGAAARGFCRSLRREILGTRICLVLFNEIWSAPERGRYIHWLSHMKGLEYESEFVVESDGRLFLPRVVPSPSFKVPETSSVELASKYWVVKDSGQITESPRPLVPPNHVLLSIELESAPIGGLRGVYGEIVETCSTEHRIKTHVAGIISGPQSNFTVVHTGQLLPIPQQWKDRLDALVPILIITCCIGFGSLKDHPRVRERRVVLALRNGEKSDLGPRLVRTLEFFGVSTVLAFGEAPQLLGVVKSGDFVLSDYDEHWESVRSICDFLGASLYFWDDPVSGTREEVGRNPWVVSDAFKDDFEFPSLLLVPPRTPLNIVETMEQKLDPCLLRPDVFYLLQGGIGSLGLQIALWMYEKGARKIVLTSRSGGRALSKKNPAASRILSYLQEQPNLVLHLECCDASSVSDTQRLLSRLPGRIGGCILLSAVWADGAYMKHTQDTYYHVFPAKIEAFRTLEQTLQIRKLDFLVTLSSVIIFGNSGQTNYSSANTAVDFMTKDYPNAFALVAPAIVDSDTVIDPDTLLPNPSLTQLVPWAMSSRQLCDCLEDGLKRLHSQAFWLYIPDLSWTDVQTLCGSSPIYNHLLPPPATSSEDTMTSYNVSVEKLVCHCLNMSSEEISPDVPLSAYGLDSVSASRLSLALRSLLTITQLQLLGDVSIGDICALIEKKNGHRPGENGRLQAQGDSISPRLSISPDSHIEAMHAMVQTYAGNFPPVSKKRTTLPIGKVVLVTGTTGGLGCHILASLISDPSVLHIYAVNRLGDVPVDERQRQAFLDRDLYVDMGKVTMMEVDLSVDIRMFDKLIDSITHIIHIAWLVDFNMGLSSYKDNIQGLRNLIDFALASQARLVYASSIGVFQNATEDHSLAETHIDAEFAQGNGYGESKWVLEELLRLAPGLRYLVARIGQLTGDLNGTWKVSEWFPSVVQSAPFLGCLPNDDKPVSWLPVNVAAQAIIDRIDISSSIVHIVHPKPVQWPQLAHIVSNELNIELVPYAEWFKLLEKSTLDAAALPAMRLVSYYKYNGETLLWKNSEAFGLPKVSAELVKTADFPQLDVNEVKKWLAYWRRVGMI